jgi:hypothetical protein
MFHEAVAELIIHVVVMIITIIVRLVHREAMRRHLAVMATIDRAVAIHVQSVCDDHARDRDRK